MRLVWGSVTRVYDATGPIQHLTVEPDDGPQAEAVAYPGLCGVCLQGDRVLLNTTAVDLALGTGGAHFVVARLPEDTPPRGVALEAPSGGRVMKLRYTPLQLDVSAVEEPAGESSAEMVGAESLDGAPVVCCGLHSQVVPAAAAVKALAPGSRVVYVMTDEAALVLAFSRAVSSALSAGLLDETVSCGQAFGGGLEAVNVYSGLLAARRVARADVVIVAIGPGVTGTATPFGHGGVAQGQAVNAVAALGGRPVVVPRVSFADTRPRHTPVSHHTLTALSRVALAPALVALPALEPAEAAAVEGALRAAGAWERHRPVAARVAALPDTRGVPLESMGRTPADDPAFFLAAAAGGEVAVRLAAGEDL